LRSLTGGWGNLNYAPGVSGVKFLSLFLERVLGYSFLSQSIVSAGADFRSFEKSGAGFFSGTDKNFVDPTGPFSATDLNKNLIVTSTLGWNGGIYKITGFIDANTITIDTRTGATEFPAAESGVAWCLLSDQYQFPAVVDTRVEGDMIRFRSPAGWGIEFTTYVYAQYPSWYSMGIRISANCIWSGPNSMVTSSVYVGFDSTIGSCATSNWFLYCCGDTNGTKLIFWAECAALNYQGNTGFSVGILSPIESGHPALSLVSLTGPTNLPHNTSTGYNVIQFVRDVTIRSALGVLLFYDADRQVVSSMYPMENAYNAYTTGFSKKGGEINHRTGKNDILPGTLYLLDDSNANNRYEFVGFLNNHWSVRNNINRHMALDVNGVKDMFHINDGIVVDWPGATPQY
jgi:hypothetical protein